MFFNNLQGGISGVYMATCRLSVEIIIDIMIFQKEINQNQRRL